MADVAFHFDPVCPFAWVTSRWVRRVQELRGLDVEWRYISLRLLNEDRDYATEFPDHYLEQHTRGLELLRVCAAAEEANGREVVGPLYEAMGRAIWEEPGSAGPEFADVVQHVAKGRDVRGILVQVGLDPELAEDASVDAWDAVIRRDTELALAAAGSDVGTPILRFEPDAGGPGFFGPVISEVPGDEAAVELWEAVEVLARHRTFAELKRSLRDVPDLPLLAEVRGRQG